ncbi:hypothetical protein ABKV19_006204 [Rosa sericea]
MGINRGKEQGTLRRPSIVIAPASFTSSCKNSIKGFLLTPNLEKGVQCFYCQSVFNNPQAVGGHLRVHQEEIKEMKSWNFPGHFSNSESVTSNTQPLTISHPENFSEGAGSHQSRLLSNGVCQFNTDQVQNFMDSMPSLSENALPCFQNNCCGKLPSLVDAVTFDPDLSSNQSPAVKEHNILDFFPCNLSQSSGQGEAGQSKKNNGGKRRCSGEAQGNAGTVNELKRTKINSDEMETDSPQKRELLLVKEEDNSNSGSGMAYDVEEGETNLDLSLHL